jgi:hypothetical protein
MAQETVERILGRILTDADFRKRFFARREDPLVQLELLDHERESLTQLDRTAVEHLADRLDPRIVRG